LDCEKWQVRFPSHIFDTLTFDRNTPKK